MVYNFIKHPVKLGVGYFEIISSLYQEVIILAASLDFKNINPHKTLTNMFKQPFSFCGRIRRTEYGLSVLIFSFGTILVQAITTGDDSGTASGTTSLIFLVLVVPFYWFLWAQGAKRCHDIGRSGWYQIIPFYGLFLLFEDGNREWNEYGVNPKNV